MLKDEVSGEWRAIESGFQFSSFRLGRMFDIRPFGIGSRCVLGVWFLLLAAMMACGGCGGSSSGPGLVPAEGAVLLDDKPLANASVMLVPQGETRGDRASLAMTNAAGKFAVASADGKRKGTAVGSYRVVISKLVKPDGSDFIPDPNVGPDETGGWRELLPSAYSDPAQCTLTAEVPAGGTKGLEFKLKGKKK
jgi:hypothetical protein